MSKQLVRMSIQTN